MGVGLDADIIPLCALIPAVRSTFLHPCKQTQVRNETNGQIEVRILNEWSSLGHWCTGRIGYRIGKIIYWRAVVPAIVEER